MKRVIYIYGGPGVGELAGQLVPTAVTRALAESPTLGADADAGSVQRLPRIEVRRIGPTEVIQGEWRADAMLFIMPGGADRPYQQALTGRGNEQLRAFVVEGGSYLGLCAGGYYGASRVVFDPGLPSAVVEDRELGFFPGVARGPAYGYGTYDPASSAGAHAAPLKLAQGGRATVYYNGGAIFDGSSSSAAVEQLAWYEDLPGTPAAVVECFVGKGRAILSGVHPEYRERDLPNDVAPAVRMALGDRAHEHVWLMLLARCGVPVPTGDLHVAA